MNALVLSLLLAGLPVGTPAPDVAAPDQSGKLVRISELRGKPVLLFFYPKDDTPGCTTEAKGLRDDWAAFQELGVVLLGVSRQDAASHRAFRARHALPFDLLTDEDGAFSEAFGVDTFPLLGLHRRQSVLLDPQGRVAHFFEDVDPAGHSAEVLAVVRRELKGWAPPAKKAVEPGP